MTQVMGILNATPDSFSDGGRLEHDLHERIARWADAGVDWFDIGGESTRPGHTPVPADEEIRRVLPVIEAIQDAGAGPISIDTSKATVAAAAIEAGATLVNDVSSLRDPDMGPCVARAGCGYVAMRSADCHGDIVAATAAQLAELVNRCEEAGIARSAIIVDPGLGFGERPGPYVHDNMALIDRLSDYAQGLPVLIGGSRKRFVGALAAEDDPASRLHGSIEVALRARAAGAAIVRVHDVEATIEAYRA